MYNIIMLCYILCYINDINYGKIVRIDTLNINVLTIIGNSICNIKSIRLFIESTGVYRCDRFELHFYDFQTQFYSDTLFQHFFPQ